MALSNPAYLRLSRHHIYYFRWPIPAVFHPLGKISHVEVSLRTRNPRLALQIGRFLSYHVENYMGHILSMNYLEIKKELQAFFSSKLEEFKKRTDSTGPLPKWMEDQFSLTLKTVEQANNEGFDPRLMPDEHNGFHQKIDEIIQDRKLSITRGTHEYDILMREHNFAYAQYLRDMLEYNNSFKGYSLSAPSISLKPANSSSLTLKQAIDDFAAERKRGNEWSEGTEKDRLAQFSLLREILGDNTTIITIEAKEAAHVKKILSALPKNRNKNAKTRNLPIQEAIAVPDVEKLHVKTVNEYLSAYQSLFGWAEANGFIPRSPFKNLNIRQKKNKNDNRQAFMPEQITTIIKALADHTLEKSGTYYRYWGVMIAIYTGARLNEIAQLNLDDIREENGIWYFDINDEDENIDDKKRLKNESSKRRVPIHDALLAAGILKHIDNLRKDKHTRLFPDLKYLKGHKYGRNLARWVNDKFLVALGIKDKKISFHSFRHSFATQLLNAGAQESLVQDLMGHSKQTVIQGVYNKGYDLKMLKTCIDKLTYKGKP